jgi:hypothetical protein
MKNIILILLLAFPTLVKCQITSNIISETEFNNIKINNVTFSNIKATNGNQNQLENLFTNSIQEADIDVDGEFYNYTYNGFTIGFSGILGSLQQPKVSSFEITNTDWNITIQGKTVTIGTHKDELGSVILNNQVGGGKSIVYQYCDGCNNFLSLYLDLNNLITKIVYIEQT